MTREEMEGLNPYVPTEARFDEATGRYELPQSVTARVDAAGNARISMSAPAGTVWHGKIVRHP